MKNFLKKIYKSESVVSGALVIALFAILSKILGLIRYSLIASRFGTGAIADSYMAAFRIPDFIYNALVLGALSTAIIPVFLNLYNRKKSKGDKQQQDLGVEASEEGMASVNIDSQQVVRALSLEDGKPQSRQKITSANAPHFELINALLNTLLLVLIIILGIVWFFTPDIVARLMPGFGKERLELTITFTRIMLLSPIIFAISNILGSILQAFKRFVWFGLAPVVYNIGIIFGILVLYPLLGAPGLAWGVVLGSVLHMLVQVPAVLSLGWRLRIVFAWQVPGVARVARLIIPRAFSLSANQINHIVNTALASTLAAGSVVIFYNAYDLESLPISLIAVSLAVASFPVLSDCFSKKNDKQFASVILSVILKIIFIMIPLSLFMILLRAHIVRLVLGYGKYNWSDTVRTLQVFGVLSASLLAQSLIPPLARAFYARENTKTPVIIGVSAIVVNISLALFLVGPYDLLGLALAFTIASFLQCLVLWKMLKQKIKELKTRALAKSFIFYTIAAMFGSIALYIALYIIDAAFGPIEHVWSLFLQTGLAFFVGVSVYLSFLVIIGDSLAQKTITSISRAVSKIKR